MKSKTILIAQCVACGKVSAFDRDPTGTLLQEITDTKCTRVVVAKAYALALRSSAQTDWRRVNEAIVKRWSVSALDWIKNQAWSGKCFNKTTRKGRG